METLHTVAFNRKQSLCSGGGICKIIFLFLFFFFLITSDFSYFFLIYLLNPLYCWIQEKAVQGEVWQSQGQPVLLQAPHSSCLSSGEQAATAVPPGSSFGFAGVVL